MSVQRILVPLLFVTVACSDDRITFCDPVPCDGDGEPGRFLPEGGEIRHENVRYWGHPVQTWIMVYQYTGPGLSSTAPFAIPEMDGHGPFGNCVDERNGAPSWPLNPITGATYLDLPKVELTGPGITGALSIVKTDPPNMVGNSTFRHYDFTYGGGAPGNPPLGFNGTLTAAMSTPGADYTLDIGKGAPMKYHMPEAYTAPLGIGARGPTDPVIIRAHQDLTYSWAPPPNDFGQSGKAHTRKTYFNVTLFADPTNVTNPAQFICLPDSEGHATIPSTVVDALAPDGLMMNTNFSYFLDARGAAPGEVRRFDLVSSYANISSYQKQ